MDNDNDFEKLRKHLQNKINSEEEKYYSKIVINEYRNPSYFGNIRNSSASAEIKGSCGDTMKIYLKIENGKISDIRFWTDGCGASIACGNMLAKIVIGKTLKEAEKVTNIDLLDALESLPDEHRHCSLLTVNTFKKSLKNYFDK